VKKIPRPSGPFPSLPSGMDKILKEHFDRFMERGALPPELMGNGIKDYKLFDDKEKLDIWRNNFKGIQFLDEKSGILLRGAVDNLLVKNGKLVVLDYKTRGYPLKEDTHEHYQTQMDIYNFLLRKNGYETEDYTYLLFYYPNKITETGEVIFDTKLIKMPTSPENGEKVFKRAMKILLSEKAPKASEDCGFCTWHEKVDEI